MESTIKVYPSAQKLETITTTLYCPEEGCTSIFTSGSNLHLHLMKTHKKQNLKRSDNLIQQYHCPEAKCVYNSNLFFKTMKLLKQHYLKVHAEKKYVCEKCQKGLPTASAQKSHIEYCGVIFKCKDCSVEYPCYETLKTHCRRKKHSVVEKTAYKTIQSPSTFPQKGTKANDNRVIIKTRTLLPKTSNLAVFIVPIPNIKGNVIERSTQTDISSNSLKLDNKENVINKRLQVCVETQTDADCIIQKPPSGRYCGMSEESPSKISTKTQTCPIGYKTTSCNTKSTLSDFEYCETPTVSRNSSGTQTSATVLNDFLYFTQTSADNINFDFGPKESLSAFDSTFSTVIVRRKQTYSEMNFSTIANITQTCVHKHVMIYF